MRDLVNITTKNLYQATYDACYKANIYLPKEVLTALTDIKENEDTAKMDKIFANSVIAAKNSRPLCQDTGQIIVFLEIGQNVYLDELPQEIINKAISDCYVDNFFRKSIVNDSLFDRTNTNNNTPTIIYTNIVRGNEIKIDLLIKGGGAENMSAVKMLTPSASEDDIINEITDIVQASGQNACPPLFLGVGIGGTLDYSSVLSKKAYFSNENKQFAEKLKKHINENSDTKVADVKMLTSSTHIACMPLAVTINCHSCRHASVLVKQNGYELLTEFDVANATENQQYNKKEIQTNEVEILKNLNRNEEILLSGTIYTARDMAHKKIIKLIEKGETLPFELKHSIIFYAGPCPKKENEQIGPIGPTTAKRMDKFAPILYDLGMLATIGKGERNREVQQSIKNNNALYFSVQGGVASLLQSCIKNVEIIAFEELGTEAIYKLEVEKLPVKVELN
ncbi:fumarate hydratase [bacterium]|nr:fumarate hydratase [bacterium]